MVREIPHHFIRTPLHPPSFYSPNSSSTPIPSPQEPSIFPSRPSSHFVFCELEGIHPGGNPFEKTWTHLHPQSPPVPSAFLLYSNDMRPILQAQNQGLSTAELSKMLGEGWKSLPAVSAHPRHPPTDLPTSLTLSPPTSASSSTHKGIKDKIRGEG